MKKVALFVMILFLFTACSQIGTEPEDKPFLAGEELIKYHEDLESFAHTISLPTYAPFSIDEFHLERFISGNLEVKDGELTKVHQEESEYWYLTFVYLSKEKQTTLMRVTIPGAKLEISLEDFTAFDELIQLGDGREGKYEWNGTAQDFHWEENGVIYGLTITTGDKEPLAKDEVIKIAESFKLYREY